MLALIFRKVDTDWWLNVGKICIVEANGYFSYSGGIDTIIYFHSLNLWVFIMVKLFYMGRAISLIMCVIWILSYWIYNLQIRLSKHYEISDCFDNRKIALWSSTIGSSTSGKSSAFGADIPQVRILSTQIYENVVFVGKILLELWDFPTALYHYHFDYIL